jgi:hypothetical protein
MKKISRLINAGWATYNVENRECICLKLHNGLSIEVMVGDEFVATKVEVVKPTGFRVEANDVQGEGNRATILLFDERNGLPERCEVCRSEHPPRGWHHQMADDHSYYPVKNDPVYQNLVDMGVMDDEKEKK